MCENARYWRLRRYLLNPCQYGFSPSGEEHHSAEQENWLEVVVGWQGDKSEAETELVLDNGGRAKEIIG